MDEVSINSNGQYVYSSFDDFEDAINPEGFFALPSVYKIQFGIKLEF